MKAPKEVIEYLDIAVKPRAEYNMIYTLFSDGAVLDANVVDDFNVVAVWVYTGNADVTDVNVTKMREQAVIDHVFGETRLEEE